ncbi:MAG: GIY-YIG nuclease family protein [Nostoc sp.]|uniref:GIY-YIG nuclease family protein n=1 Tax=Nostoc sp. TaxID=1180 RepID=UPI002FFB0A17
MKFNVADLLPEIPAIKLAEDFNPPPGVFRFSLSDFILVWKGFPSKNIIEKRQRLEKIFNTDYFDAYTVVADAISLNKLIYTDFYDPSPKNGSGFIYLYTFEDNVLAGKYSQGLLWWTYSRYETKLKIGRTEQNVLNRIDQQLLTRTSISEPPILLSAFWTNLVVQCERNIHYELRNKRLSDNMGRAARGGIEWFKDTPTLAIPIILKWITRYRIDPYSSSLIPVASESELEKLA